MRPHNPISRPRPTRAASAGQMSLAKERMGHLRPQAAEADQKRLRRNVTAFLIQGQTASQISRVTGKVVKRVWIA